MPDKAKRYTGKKRPSGAKFVPPGETARGSANDRGYGRKWRNARAVYLKNNPLCVACREAGHVREATVVDHKEPHRGDPSLFWDVANWQSLCEWHHNSKTGKGK